MHYSLMAWFLGVLAFNVTASVIAFAIAFGSRRKEYPIGWLRGGMVFIAGWLAGSVIVFLLHMIMYSVSGIVIPEMNSSSLEFILALGVLLPVMFLLFRVLRQKR